MNQDVESYVSRIRGYLGNGDPMELLAGTPDRLARIVTGANERELQKQTEPGRWSRAQVLAHFAEGEIAFGWRIRMIVSGSGTPIQGYDQTKWVERAGYLSQSPQQAFELFKTLRNANLSFLKSLPEEAWHFYGIHSERGKESLQDLVSLTAGHDLNHLRQLE